MASLNKDNRGRFRIQFADGDGRRRTLYLGDADKKAAEGIKPHVERLVNARHYAQPLPAETLAWLAKIGSKLHGSIVVVGLAEPRHTPPVVTLATVIDTHTARRGPTVTPGTRAVWAQARRHLCKHFGEAAAADGITPAEADDFRRAMLADYSEAFTSKIMQMAKAFFRDGVRRKLIASSPFVDVKNGSQRNPARQHYVDHETIARVIDAAPDAEWRLLLALARYAGLRVPSEPLALKWADVNLAENRMTVRSCKTERHAGGEARIVPIFPELRPFLEDVEQLAEPGQEYLITRWRKTNTNLRTRLLRMLERAGVKPWPRLFQNLRASCATDLANVYASHKAAAWLGHNEAIANKHYRQVTAADYAEAAKRPLKPADDAAKTPEPCDAYCNVATARNDTQGAEAQTIKSKETPDFPLVASDCDTMQNDEWAMRDSNPRLPRCKRGTLAAELIALDLWGSIADQ
jgi:integrase